MANKSVITYIPPISKFVMVSNSLVEKYSPEVVGVYCKIVKLSNGKSLSIDFLSKKIDVKEYRVRRIVVFLENEGYVVRKALRDEKGFMCGWNYCIYPEPVPEKERSHAGKKKKKENEESSVFQDFRQDGKSDKTEKCEDNILSDIGISSNKENLYNDKEKKDTDVSKKERDLSLFPNEEEVFEGLMKEQYPYVMKMDKPLTMQQYNDLKKDYGEEIVLDVLNAMDNSKQLTQKYRDAYKTAKNWCKIRRPEKKEEKEETDSDIPSYDVEAWQRSQKWMQDNTPRIASKVSYYDYKRMRDMVDSRGDIYAQIMKEIDQSGYKGDIVKEFDRLMNTDKYYLMKIGK